jgi:threonine dehydrogenase-like Zn-dependent dehydrogenase
MRAMVLRDGRLEVRETADPVPGPGQLLLRPLSAAICASDVHYMDHPHSAPRFVWDSGRDTIMGHEFIGEVVGHGPDCSGDFSIGSRVTSLPLLIREGAEPHVIGHDPDAPGAFGELMLVSEVLARTVPDGVPNDAIAVVDAFAVGEFYVRSSAIGPGELPLVVGAGAIGLSAVAARVARGVGPIVVSDYSAERLEYAQKFGADVMVNPAERDPYAVWREAFRSNNFQTPQVIFECVGAPGLLQNIVDSCEFLARVFAAGGWHGIDSVSVTEATHKGVTIQFGGGPHPVDWYGTLDAVVDGRLDPLPSIGKVIGLDEVPAAIDQARKSQGPPRVVVHPTAS